MRNILLYVIFLLIITSCSDSAADDKYDIIEFDICDSIYVKLNDVPGIVLDKQVVIGTIKDVKIIDSILFIHSSTGLHSFDLSGNLRTSYSRKGRGSEEYSMLWTYNLMDDVVQLYDMNRKMILEYDFDGNFIQSITLPGLASDNPFQVFVSLGEGYLGKRVYGGYEVPELALYDKEFRYIRDLSVDLFLRSGLMLHNPFTLNYRNNILFCRYFSNEVYEISPTGIDLRYKIDFGKHSFREESNLIDEYEIIERINSSRKKYAVNFSEFQEDERFLSFCYIYDASKRIAIFDRKENLSYSFTFFSDDEITEYILRYENNIYIITQNDVGETKLYYNTMII